MYDSESLDEIAQRAIDKKSRLDDHLEGMVLKNISSCTIEYIFNFIKKRSEIFEKELLSKNKYWANAWGTGVEKFIVDYAKIVIKDRWKECEKKLLSVELNHYHSYYANLVKNRWPELEKKIIENTNDESVHCVPASVGNNYALDILKSRWPEFEKKLLELSGSHFNTRFLIPYAQEIIKNEWPELQKKIIKESDTLGAVEYCKRIKRDEELEKVISNNSDYRAFVKKRIEKFLKNKNYDEILKYCNYQGYSSIIKSLHKKHFIPDILKNSILAKSLAGDKESLKAIQEDKWFKTKIKCLIEELLVNNSISETSTVKDILRVL